VFIFSLQLLKEFSRNSAPDCAGRLVGFQSNVRDCYPILAKNGICQQILVKISKPNSVKNLFSGSSVVTREEADGQRWLSYPVPFRNSALRTLHKAVVIVR